MSKRTAELLPTGKVQENGGGKPEPARYVITGARVVIDLGQYADGFVSGPMTITSEVSTVYDNGRPKVKMDLRELLHEAADAAVDRLALLRREGV